MYQLTATIRDTSVYDGTVDEQFVTITGTLGETEERKWICSFSVRSQQVEEIRADLGWQPMQHFYNMHITLCEKPV